MAPTNDPRTEAIQSLAEPILTSNHLELVELACHRQGPSLMVRLLVDTVGGVTIQQCARANQQISQALEQSNLIEEPYTVEVSSPGLDRPLVTRRDYERAVGEDLDLDVVHPDGKVRPVQGMLLALQTDAVVIKTAGGNITLPMEAIRSARKAIRLGRRNDR